MHMHGHSLAHYWECSMTLFWKCPPNCFPHVIVIVNNLLVWLNLSRGLRWKWNNARIIKNNDKYEIMDLLHMALHVPPERESLTGLSRVRAITLPFNTSQVISHSLEAYNQAFQFQLQLDKFPQDSRLHLTGISVCTLSVVNVVITYCPSLVISLFCLLDFYSQENSIYHMKFLL